MPKRSRLTDPPLTFHIPDPTAKKVTLSNLTLHLWFWGTAWGNVDNVKLSRDLRTKIAALANSNYFDGLDEYCRARVQVKLAPQGPEDQNTASDPPSKFTDPAKHATDSSPDVPTEIRTRVGKMPPKPGNHLYLLVMPPGVTCKDDGCDGEPCEGQHFYLMLDPKKKAKKIYYGWVLFGTIDRLTTLISEEIVETITNPEPSQDAPTGWVIKDGLGKFREICDVCADITLNVKAKPAIGAADEVRVQAYYSRVDKDHAIAGPAHR